MQYIQFILIGLGLAMDAFAVSLTSGVAIRNMHIKHALRIGLFFGVFQAVMPYIGWKIGNIATNYIQAYDHWIAFVLLAGVGGKMIYEAFIFEKEERESDPLNIYVLFILAIATSIDALVIGVTFSVLDIAIIAPIIIIGIITFIMSFAGTYIGNSFGHKFDEKKVEITGGAILILIGLKILIQHLYFQ